MDGNSISRISTNNWIQGPKAYTMDIFYTDWNKLSLSEYYEPFYDAIFFVLNMTELRFGLKRFIY